MYKYFKLVPINKDIIRSYKDQDDYLRTRIKVPISMTKLMTDKVNKQSLLEKLRLSSNPFFSKLIDVLKTDDNEELIEACYFIKFLEDDEYELYVILKKYFDVFNEYRMDLMKEYFSDPGNAYINLQVFDLKEQEFWWGLDEIISSSEH